LRIKDAALSVNATSQRLNHSRHLPIQFRNDMLAFNQDHRPMPPLTDSIRIRKAVVADIPGLHALIDASVRGLMDETHTPAQIDGALGTVLGLDTQLVADGTYFAAESVDASGKSAIVACGGWSKCKTLFGSDHREGREDDLLDPVTDAAKIRAFFVHPNWIRLGIGTQILEACESAACAAGFTRFELGATPLAYLYIRCVDIPPSNKSKSLFAMAQLYLWFA
jgi:GNAT superfamily N-acetyltransferase